MPIYSPSLTAAEVQFCLDNGMESLRKWRGSSGFKASYLTEEDLGKLANLAAADATEILMKYTVYLDAAAEFHHWREEVGSDKFSLSN